MKQHLQDLIGQAIHQLQERGQIDIDTLPKILISDSRNPEHGDFACNVAMMLAKLAKKAPRQLAQMIIEALPESARVSKVVIAGPGFINFFQAADNLYAVVPKILTAAENYGLSQLGAGKKVQVEFVSANPTGPLHVGHGRGAAYGATVANLLEAIGFEVHREYYVNDAGRQMDILAASVWLRYLELCGEELTFPSNGYKGDYIWDIAATLHREHQEAFRQPISDVLANVCADEPAGGDKERHIDDLIAAAKRVLGESDYRVVFDQALKTILDDIRDDLALFGVEYQRWYSERSLMEGGAVDRALERLKTAGHLYEKEGAWWFRSSDFGDEKDRVVLRDNGQSTYFASDIAYHMEKLERGFDRVIDVWGADHHGYVPRVKAALTALGSDADKMDVLLVQFAVLYRGGEKLAMSTRSGQFVTLRQLRKEVGSDAARFFYVMRRCEQHMDFDLDLAKSQSNENPLYYIQYAYARICSVQRQLAEKGLLFDQEQGLAHLDRLAEKHESELLSALARYPDVVEKAALNEEPHQLVHALRELAHAFHSYYNAHQFLVDDEVLRNARLSLVTVTGQTLLNGLSLLGVAAPQEM
ncbi:MAG: arginine--tRNA ligase [Gammaproteobacteria bacterium]|nr:arginine--tRNA ligase [Gammaproteobacteria bacterium]